MSADLQRFLAKLGSRYSVGNTPPTPNQIQTFMNTRFRQEGEFAQPTHQSLAKTKGRLTETWISGHKPVISAINHKG